MITSSLFVHRRRQRGPALLALLVSAGIIHVAAAQTAGRMVASADLQADAAILRQAYEAMHPGLYRYNTRQEMAARWAALDTAFNHDQTQAEAFLAISRLTAAIRCGHSYPNFYNQTDSVAAALFQRAPLLPFQFRWVDRRMYVTAPATNATPLARGTEILTIDGVPVRAILDSLLPLLRADGHNDAKRITLLEVQGLDTYETFDIYYSLVFPPSAPRFAVTLRRPGRDTIEQLSVPAITYAQRVAPILGAAANRRGGTEPLWTMTYPDARTAYLRMDSWETWSTKWTWEPWLHDQMAAIARRGVATLIVDLRRNEGGTDVGDVILAHLVDGDLALPAYHRLTRYRRAPDTLRPYLDTWDASFRDWGSAAIEADTGFYRLTKYNDPAGGNIIHAAAPKFAGKLVVLVGPENSSATFNFAQVVQQKRLGILVGQPTGGNQRGINGGAFIFLRLPHSGLEVDLPLIGSFPDGARPDAGLTPDVVVADDPQDLATGHDATLHVARHPLGGLDAAHFGAALRGRWTGDLTYRDYGTNRMVTLPTILDVTDAGEAGLRLAYTYDDGPGKIVRDTSLVLVDRTANTYTVSDTKGVVDTRYAIAGATGFEGTRGGTIALDGTGTDNNLPVEVRNTIRLTADSLVIRRDVRPQDGVYQMRHEYHLARSTAH